MNIISEIYDGYLGSERVNIQRFKEGDTIDDTIEEHYRSMSHSNEFIQCLFTYIWCLNKDVL